MSTTALCVRSASTPSTLPGLLGSIVQPRPLPALGIAASTVCIVAGWIVVTGAATTLLTGAVLHPPAPSIANSRINGNVRRSMRIPPVDAGRRAVPACAQDPDDLTVNRHAEGRTAYARRRAVPCAFQGGKT